MLLALRKGDFATALKLADEFEHHPSKNGLQIEELGLNEFRRVESLRELGDPQAAGRAAKVFLDRLAALSIGEQMFDTPDPFMLASALAGGQISAQTLATQREKWLSDQRAQLREDGWRTATLSAWAAAYDVLSEPTKAEAEEALRALEPLAATIPTVAVPLWSNETVHTAESIGAILLGARRLDEAIAWLTIAAKSCFFIPNVRATLLLGRAYEERHDVAEACAAYAKVEAMWPDAKPRSVSIEQARSRRKKLSCPASP